MRQCIISWGLHQLVQNYVKYSVIKGKQCCFQAAGVAVTLLKHVTATVTQNENSSAHMYGLQWQQWRGKTSPTTSLNVWPYGCVCVSVSFRVSQSRRSRGGRWRRAAGGWIPACGPASSGSDGHTGPEEGQSERHTGTVVTTAEIKTNPTYYPGAVNI